jgi:hypothetical protein
MECGSTVASPCRELPFFGWKAVNRLMAEVIEFYIPSRFQRKVAWVPPRKHGKVIEFCTLVKKSA